MIFDRAKEYLSDRKIFGWEPLEICELPNITLPKQSQMILRMMIRSPEANGYKIPSSLNWLKPVIEQCDTLQQKNSLFQPYVYVTIRHGFVTTITDDLWHVDGFSMRIRHVPEQNYIWASNHGTEVLPQKMFLPKDFDPFRHNIHQYFQDVADESRTLTLKPKTLYVIDPYVIHRRPVLPEGVWRTFFRISFVPIEIEDDTNTANPLLPDNRPYGRVDVHNRLERYSAKV